MHVCVCVCVYSLVLAFRMNLWKYEKLCETREAEWVNVNVMSQWRVFLCTSVCNVTRPVEQDYELRLLWQTALHQPPDEKKKKKKKKEMQKE